jgi:hypothetical protein
MPRFAAFAVLLAASVPAGAETRAFDRPALAQAAPPAGRSGTPASEPVPQVLQDLNALPAPVRRLRDQLVAAAKSGDIERLRPIFEANETPPIITLGDRPKDPIAFWKEASGDREGREILAILLDILDAGYVHTDAGTPRELYVWPYFYRYPIDKLTPGQIVELLRIVTGPDFNQMKEDGGYAFFRLGIGPDGTWHFFVAGE